MPLYELANDSLVRYTCMVQDMFGPEYYCQTMDILNRKTGIRRTCSGRYRDVANCSVRNQLYFVDSEHLT